MDTKKLDEYLVDYLYDELDPRTKAEFEAALSANPQVRDKLEAFERTRLTVRELPELEPPAGISARLLAEAERAAPAPRVGWLERLRRGLQLMVTNPALSAAVMLLVVVGISLYVYRRGGPRSSEPPTDLELMSSAERGPAAISGSAPAAQPASPPAVVQEQHSATSDDKAVSAAPQGESSAQVRRAGGSASQGRQAQGSGSQGRRAQRGPAIHGGKKRAVTRRTRSKRSEKQALRPAKTSKDRDRGVSGKQPPRRAGRPKGLGGAAAGGGLMAAGGEGKATHRARRRHERSAPSKPMSNARPQRSGYLGADRAGTERESSRANRPGTPRPAVTGRAADEPAPRRAPKARRRADASKKVRRRPAAQQAKRPSLSARVARAAAARQCGQAFSMLESARRGASPGWKAAVGRLGSRCETQLVKAGAKRYPQLARLVRKRRAYYAAKRAARKRRSKRAASKKAKRKVDAVDAMAK